MTRKIIIALFVIASVLAIGFIFYNSLTVSKVSNAESNTVAQRVQSVVDPNERISKETFDALIRKAAHVIEFGALGCLVMGLAVVIAGKKKRRVMSCIFAPLFIVLFIGVLDEFIQSFNDRTSLVKDVLIDFGGGLIGIILVGVIYGIVRFSKRR